MNIFKLNHYVIIYIIYTLTDKKIEIKVSDRKNGIIPSVK